MHRFISNSPKTGIRIVDQGGSQLASQVVFTKDCKLPVTVCTELPVRGPGKHAFQVVIPVKQQRTAVGWMGLNSPVTNYMTPDFGMPKPYVSMGGAGFIYPLAVSTGTRYGEGDTVKSEIDFDNKTVTFWVNNKLAGTSAWTGPDFAYAAISSTGGEVVCDVSFF